MVIYMNNNDCIDAEDDLDKILLTLAYMVRERFYVHDWTVAIDLDDDNFVVRADAARWCSTAIVSDMLLFGMNQSPNLLNYYFSVPLCDPDAVEKWWNIIECKLDTWVRSGSW